MATTNATIFYSIDDDKFVAIDTTRPGCSAVADNEMNALKQLYDARKAWDMAKRTAEKQGNNK